MCPDPGYHDPCFEGPFLLMLHAFHERNLESGAKRFCKAVQLGKWVEKRKGKQTNKKTNGTLLKTKWSQEGRSQEHHSQNTKPDSPIHMTTASTSQNLQRRAQKTLSVELQGPPFFGLFSTGSLHQQRYLMCQLWSPQHTVYTHCTSSTAVQPRPGKKRQCGWKANISSLT